MFGDAPVMPPGKEPIRFFIPPSPVLEATPSIAFHSLTSKREKKA